MTGRPSVLLVDDDVDTREMYGLYLEARGFTVHTAGSTPHGVAVAAAEHPDVIVTDFTLPGEDGFVLAARVRQTRGLAETPLVLVSGRAFVGGSGERALGLFDRVLLKPVLPDDLIAEFVPLLLDRTSARLQRQLGAVRERVRAIPTGSGIGRVMAALEDVAEGEEPPAALLADGSAHYIEVNEAACSLTGRSREELLALSVWDLTPEVALAEGRRLWNQFVAGGTLTGPYRLRTPAGVAVEATYAAAANVLPGCHLSLLHPLPPALILDQPAV